MSCHDKVRSGEVSSTLCQVKTCQIRSRKVKSEQDESDNIMSGLIKSCQV